MLRISLTDCLVTMEAVSHSVKVDDIMERSDIGLGWREGIAGVLDCKRLDLCGDLTGTCGACCGDVGIVGDASVGEAIACDSLELEEEPGIATGFRWCL